MAATKDDEWPRNCHVAALRGVSEQVKGAAPQHHGFNSATEACVHGREGHRPHL